MLHVWLRAQHSPLLVWQAAAKQWQALSGWQQLQESYNDYYGYKSGSKPGRDKKLCLYFPSTHLLQVDTQLSASQLKQLGDSGKQYLFEESSITAVEQLTVRQQSYGSSHHLYALAKDDIESWQQSAILAGFSISALLPDFLLLPVPEEGAGQQVVMYQDAQTTLLRQSPQQGMAVSYLPLVFERLPYLSEVYLVAALDQSASAVESAPTVADLHNGIEDSLIDSASIDLSKTDSSTSVTINGDTLTNTQKDDFATQTSALLAEQQILLTSLSAQPTPIDAPERHALNFFVKTSDTKLSPYLRVAAMVAMSALVLQIAADGLQVYRYNAASEATQTAIASQFQSWFPEDRLNPRTQLQTQMSAKLRSSSQAPASHMAILARISPLIKQSSLQAQTLVMQPSMLSFTLIAPNRDSLDEFANTLVAQGIAANLQRVNGNEQGEFSGQITVNIVEGTDETVQPAVS